MDYITNLYGHICKKKRIMQTQYLEYSNNKIKTSKE